MQRRWMTASAVLGLGLTMVSAAGASAPQYAGPRYFAVQERGWDEPPAEFLAAQRRGYKDGVEGARKDFENHRPPNPNNRDEFRNPKFIAAPDRRDYRNGFRRGYDEAVRHMYGGRGPQY